MFIKKENTMKKIFLVLAALLLLAVGSGCAQSSNQGEVKNTNQVVQPEVGDTLKIITDTIQEGASALDLLQKESSEKGFIVTVEESSYGKFISAIGTKKGGTDNKYWMFYVNGEQAQVGAADYKVKAGDIIEFKFE